MEPEWKPTVALYRTADSVEVSNSWESVWTRVSSMWVQGLPEHCQNAHPSVWIPIWAKRSSLEHCLAPKPREKLSAPRALRMAL